jgi:hypothetical protein
MMAEAFAQVLAPPDPWVTAAEAGRLLGGLDVRTVRRLADQGYIGQRVLPVGRVGFNRADLERLMASAIRPATRKLEPAD